MKVVKIEEWRDYFAGEIETRYGVDRGNARKRAEELLESMFGEQKLEDTGDGHSEPIANIRFRVQ